MRPEKQYMLDDIKRRVTGSEFAYFLDYTRLTVERMNEMRGKLRAAGAEVHVVRNRLLKLVGTGLKWTGFEQVTRKPTALVTGKDDIAAARVLRDYARADERPVVVKGGMLKGAFLDAGEVVAIADLPSRETLYAMLAGTLAAPMRGLVGALNQKLSSIVYVLNAIEKKKGEAAGSE